MLNLTLINILIISFIVGGFVSCTFLKETIGIGPKPPAVQLESIGVKSASLTELYLIVKIRVENPNRFSLDFSKLKYQLKVENQLLAKGLFEKEVSINSQEAKIVELPLSIDMTKALKVVKKIFQGDKKVMAIWNGTATFNTPIGDIDVDFENQKPIG